MMASQNILLVGCGKMGTALVRGWRAHGVPAANIWIIEPFAESMGSLQKDLSVNVVTNAAEIIGKFAPDIIVFAVKPQGMEEILPAYAHFTSTGAAFLSIAAGRTISFFENLLGVDAAVIRTMPNTPAAVGRGITAAYSNAQVTNEQRAVSESLLEAVGEVVWVEDEVLIDPVTAVSGSGPAYVFLLIECIAKAGEAQGLSADTAAQLACATVAGSGELARRSNKTAASLRENVTSPGGTTAAALGILMAEDGLQRLMNQAIKAATERSRELAG
jgi:pyrroline-5-carboxylate reductase